MSAAPGLPVGIAGLPPLLAQMSRGRAYTADVASDELAAALAAGTLAQNFVQKRPSAAIAGEGLPGLLESLRRRDIDVQRAQARGLMRFFRAQPDWASRRQRAGSLQFLDELDHFGIDSLGLLLVDGADGLFDWDNPAALREVSKSLIYGLARCADELGELFLGHVVGDEQAVGRDLAELLAEIHQGLCHTTGNIGEHQIRHGLIGATQSSCQSLEQGGGNLGATCEPWDELLMTEPENRGIGECGGGSAAGAGIEQAELTAHLTWAEHQHQ